MPVAKRKLQNWLNSYMDYTDPTEPPELFRMWCAVSAVAAALRRKCFLKWGTITFFPNMYIVLVSPAGRARKGTAMAPVCDMVGRLQVPMAAEAITREALIRTLAEAKDNTVDSESGAVSTHCSLTVFSPELTVFLGYNNFQLMSDLTDWYDCRTKWTYRTKNVGTDVIDGVWVNLLGATTPDLIRSALPLDAIGGGLTSRMIFVYEPRKGKIVPAPFLSRQQEQLGEDLYHDLEIIAGLSGQFKVTRKFLELWHDWYTAQEDNPPFKDPRFDGYVERRPNHVMKLSMIMSAARSDNLHMDEVDLRNAIHLLEMTEKKMQNAFGGVGSAQVAATLHAVMTELSIKGEMAVADLLQMFWRDANYAQMQQIIETLVKMNFAKKVLRGHAEYIVASRQLSASTEQSCIRMNDGVGGRNDECIETTS